MRPRGRDLLVTASVGGALSAARAYGGRRPEDLLRAADRAMYRAKRSGQARYEIIDPDTDDAPGHPSAGNDLGQVVDRAGSPYPTSGG